MTGKVKGGIQALSQVCNLSTVEVHFSELKLNVSECHNSPKVFYSHVQQTNHKPVEGYVNLTWPQGSSLFKRIKQVRTCFFSCRMISRQYKETVQDWWCQTSFRVYCLGLMSSISSKVYFVQQKQEVSMQPRLFRQEKNRTMCKIGNFREGN